jgi:HK97 family phage major capsid protein
MQTYAEQISAYEAKRASCVAGMRAIMDKSAEAGETLDAAQQEEYDTYEKDIDAIDGQLVRLKKLDALNVEKATPVVDVKSAEDASKLRASYGSVQLKARPAKGIAFTRLLGAKYMAMQHHCAPWDIAKRWTDTPEVEMVLRAAVTPGSTTDATFAEPLVQLNTMTGEFIELLRAKEIIGRIPGLDRIPFNVKVPRGTADPTAYWVGQGDVKPLSRPAFDSVTLTFAKVAGIVPMTEELLRLSNPSAEMKVRLP